MKLALVRRAFSPVGGAELYLQRLLSALREAGHELHLVCESWAGSPEGVVIHPLEVRASRSTRPLVFAEAVDRFFTLNKFDCVFSLERTLRQDVYRAGDGVHRQWLEQRRRYLPWWRTFWTGGFHRAMLALEKQTFHPQRTGMVIVNSEMVRNEIVSHFQFPTDRIVLVRNGVQVERFRSGKRVETRKKHGLKEDDFVCLFVGSGWERKGLKYLIDAFPMAQSQLSQRGKKLKLLVAGKGRPPTRNPDIRFTGPVRDVENLYAAADLFTFVPIYEPSANVCVEALAAGLPVITSRFNGAAELITGPDLGAVLEEPSDLEKIAGEIVRFGSRSERSRVSAPGNVLSIEENADETIRVLESAARKNSAG